MFDNTYLSKLEHYSRSIVVETLDDIYSFSKIGYSLLNIFLLYLEEKILLVLDMFFINIKANCSDFKIPLLGYKLEKSLAGTILYLYLISYVKLLRARIASSLLLINLAMFLLAVLSY